MSSQEQATKEAVTIPKSSMRYEDKGKRDLRLDWLRGYALFAMAINHFGTGSHFRIITGGSEFLINAAEVFFFISGFTLGFISISKPLEVTVKRLVNRTRVIYLYTLLITFGYTILLNPDIYEMVLGSNRGYNFLEYDISTQVEVLKLLLATLLMKFAAFGADILITYVVYMALAPLAIWALHKKHTKGFILTLAFFYLASQISLELTELPFHSFRHLVANSPLFYGGMVLGYKREILSKWWDKQNWNKYADAFTVFLGIGLLVLYIIDFEGIESLGAFLAAGDFAIREYVMPIQNLAVVGLYLRIFWLMITLLWEPLFKALGWLVLPFGQASLFTFSMHYVAGFLAYFIPLTDIIMETENELALMVVDMYYIAILFGLVILRKKSRTWLSLKPDRLEEFDKKAVPYMVLFFIAIWIILMFIFMEPGGWSELDGFTKSEDYDGDFEDYEEIEGEEG